MDYIFNFQLLKRNHTFYDTLFHDTLLRTISIKYTMLGSLEQFVICIDCFLKFW